MRKKKKLSQTLTIPSWILPVLISGVSAACGLIYLISIETATNHYLEKSANITRTTTQTSPEILATQDRLFIGITAKKSDTGVFSSAQLASVLDLSKRACETGHPYKDETNLVAKDYLALDTVDLTPENDLASSAFRPLLSNVPENDEQALEIANKGTNNVLFSNKIISSDKKSTAMILPMQINGYSWLVKKELNALWDRGKKEGSLLFAGLPLARETFFKAMQRHTVILSLCSLALMICTAAFFVRPVILTMLALFPPTCTVLCCLGLQALFRLPAGLFSFIVPWITGTVTLLSSAFFLLFFSESFTTSQDVTTSLEHAANQLLPRLRYLTYSLGTGLLLFLFSSSSSIVFLGLTLALGMVISYVATAFSLPVFLRLIAPGWLRPHKQKQRFFRKLSPLTPATLYSQSLPLIIKFRAVAMSIHGLLALLCIIGVILIKTNDNPLQWFTADHDIPREAAILGKQFQGIFALDLIINAKESGQTVTEAGEWLFSRLRNSLWGHQDVRLLIQGDIQDASARTTSSQAFADYLANTWQHRIQQIPIEDDLSFELWSNALDTLLQLRHEGYLFLRPDILHYIEKLQDNIARSSSISQTLAVTDIIKATYQSIFEQDPQKYTIPATANGVAQTLAIFKKGRNPERLNRFISPDAQQIMIELTLPSPSKEVVEQAMAQVSVFFKNNNPPAALNYTWGGAAYDTMTREKQGVESMLAWGILGIAATAIVLSLFLRSWIAGGLLAGCTVYVIVLSFGFFGVTGNSIGMFTTSQLPFILVFCFVFFGIQLFTFQSLVKETGSWRGDNARLQQRYQGAAWINTLLFAGILPLFFSPYTLLQTTAKLFILQLLATGLIMFTLFPVLLDTFQGTLFRKETNWYAARQEIINAAEEHEDTGTQKTIIPA
ncbi:MAG: hypothetical protein CSA32_02825 [Desulfobulbus propionicus]|nr:MAG: hypothetical protein CSA32_02825 [Desulfobulbus propionicus]